MRHLRSFLPFLLVLVCGFSLSARNVAAQSLLYVLSQPPYAWGGESDVFVINTATGHTIARIFVAQFAPGTTPVRPAGLAVRSDGSRGYVADGTSVFVLDPAANTLTNPFAAGPNPGDLVLSPDASQLFVVNVGAATISVVATATNQVTSTIALGGDAGDLAVSPDGARLYVLGPDSVASLYVVDLASMAVTRTVSTEAHPGYLAVSPDSGRIYISHRGSSGNSVTVIDTVSMTQVARLSFPALTEQGPPSLTVEPDLLRVSQFIGRPSVLPDGSRLYVPEWTEMWFGSPAGFDHTDRVFVIDTAGLTLLATVDIPRAHVAGAGPSNLPEGPLFALVAATGPRVFTLGPLSTASIDPATGATTLLGPGIISARAVSVVAARPCWFELWPLERYVRAGAETLTIDAPAPAGCGWTASTSADWLAVASGASGTGPGTVSVRATIGDRPGTAAVNVGGGSVKVHSLLSAGFFDTPAAGTTVTLPFDVAGWIVDRADYYNGSSWPGVSDPKLYDQPDQASPVLVNPAGVGQVPRPDVAALYGWWYLKSGFRVRVGRLSAGPHTLQVRGRSSYNGDPVAISTTITVQRNPLIAMDRPPDGARVTLPFQVYGWAVDGTAPSGTGVDAVHVWAYPASGSPIFLGAAMYGVGRGDVAESMGWDFAWTGFTLNVAGLKPGVYTITAFAHCTQTGTFDAVASAQVTILQAASLLPFGQMETPAQNAAGVVGAIGVSGWALDDVGVASVKIYRNCLAFDDQANCQTLGGFNVVYIGDADFVTGARPDVEGSFPFYPQASRAGWGCQLLTNMLPDVPNQVGYGGQGQVTLYAFATDVDGNMTLLGRKAMWQAGGYQTDNTPTTITLANDTLAKPFGAIDTPGQGQTVSGVVANFGWALTPDDGSGIEIPTDGSTMVVYIDGAAVGNVAYNQCRGNVGNPVPAGLYCNDDVASIFGNTTPQTTFTTRTSNPTVYRNLDAGRATIGAYVFDTRTLANGVHTIAWGVTDSAGRPEGIGSRFFTVLNGSSDTSATAVDALAGSADSRASVTSEQTSAGLKPRPAGALAARSNDAVGRASRPADADAGIERNAYGARAVRPAGAVRARTGFDLQTPYDEIGSNEAAIRSVQIPELGRLELSLGPVETGYLVANGTLRDLPAGSHLDRATGLFTWMPGPGYVGSYRLTFLRGSEQVIVDVTIRPVAQSPGQRPDVDQHRRDRQGAASSLPRGGPCGARRRSTRRKRSAGSAFFRPQSRAVEQAH